MMMITDTLVVIPGFMGHAASFSYASLSPFVVIAAGVMAMVSTAVGRQALAHQIAKTGVLNSFAIGEAQQIEEI